MQTEIISQRSKGNVRQAFTLIELLVSMAVLSLLMVMVFQMVDQVQKTWNVARTRVSQFREARVAFDAVTRNLTQATLNTYYDYDYGNGLSVPDQNNLQVPKRYQRQSDLHFICGPSSTLLGNASGADNRTGHAIFFQIPGGFGTKSENSQLNDLLNSRGYFVEYGEDSSFKPSFLSEQTKPRYRFRLMEFRPPTDKLLVYLSGIKEAGVDAVGVRKWFEPSIGEGAEFDGGTVVRPIADNIIAVFFLPKFPDVQNDSNLKILSDDYTYDSREWQYANSSSIYSRAAYSKNLLPPLIEITMVAVDEKSMIRYQQLNGGDTSMPAFVPKTRFERYTNYQSFTDDLDEMRDSLDNKKVSFRVFNQTVPLRGAGWSRTSS